MRGKENLSDGGNEGDRGSWYCQALNLEKKLGSEHSRP